MTCRSTMNHRAKKKPQISPLRCAPVEMTNLLQGHDLVSMRQRRQSLKKFVISTEGIMEQWATQGDERRSIQQLLSMASNCFPWNRYPTLCHPERSRGICSSTGLSWKCFRQGVTQCRGLRFQPLLGKELHRSQTDLSSRPERSGVERSAVSFRFLVWHV
jgi:hypothetical protein